jgi:uncharacterized protein (UPF0332 family)
MSYVSQLLDQAEHLASRERGRPQQASLRRAVSTTYYALFHYLIARSTRQLVGGRQASAIRQILARSYVHSEMKATSRTFTNGRGGLPPIAQAALAGTAFPPGLGAIAQEFVDLQTARHAADYDRNATFSRQDVQNLVSQTRTTINAWPTLEQTAAGRCYLLALLVPGMLKAR